MQLVRLTKRQIAKIARRSMDLIYPPQCACCGEEIEAVESSVDLCEDCQKQLIPLKYDPCPRCGALIDGPNASPQGCFFCKNTRQLHFDSVIVLGGYHSKLKNVVARMKTPASEPLALAIGKLLAIHRREMLEKLAPDIVIPIPMYWRQRLKRQMNSPTPIGAALSRMLGVPFRHWILYRCKKTLTQSELTPKQRIINVRGSFNVRFAKNIHGRRILLVDDVLTTGATCSEAARILKEAGATMVAVAAVARAQGENR